MNWVLGYFGIGALFIVFAVAREPGRIKRDDFRINSFLMLTIWFPLLVLTIYTTLKRPRVERCSRCAGMGHYKIGPRPTDDRTCPDCRGLGQRRVS